MSLDIRRYINKYIDPVKIVESGVSYFYDSNKTKHYCSASIRLEIVSHENETIDNPGYELFIHLKEGIKIDWVERIRRINRTGYYIKKYPEDIADIADNVLKTLVTNKNPTDEEIALLRDGF